MTRQSGTLENLALEMVKVFQPLVEEIKDGDKVKLMVELGFPVSPAQLDALASPFEGTAASVQTLLNLSKDLLAEINKPEDSVDYFKIIGLGIDLTKAIKNAVDTFTALKNALQGLSLPNVNPADLQAFPNRMLNFLLLRYFELIPGLNEIFEFTTVLTRTEKNKGSVDPFLPPYILSDFQFGRMSGWLSDPFKQLKDTYDWGKQTFDGKKLLPKLERIIARSGAPALLDESAELPVLDLVSLEFRANKDVNPPGLEILLNTKVEGDPQTMTFDEWRMTFDMDFNGPSGMRLIIQPNGNFQFIPPDTSNISGRLFLEFAAKRPGGEPFVLLQFPGGSRLSLNEFIVRSDNQLVWKGDHAEGRLDISGEIRDLKLLIDLKGGDSFLSSVLPQVQIENTLNLLLGVTSDGKIYFGGSGGLEIRLPAHFSIGPIEVIGLSFGLFFKDQSFPVVLGASVRFLLGPFTVVAENLGLKTTFTFPESGGNLGAAQADIGFKPPNGLGLVLDAGAVQGGGYLYFDIEKGEYAGVAELTIAKKVSVKAIGIITTKLPDGRPGYSFLLIITAEFVPIQLGFGFTLNGVGGLIGINRGMQLEALAQGVRENTISYILFPSNPVADAPRIIANMNTFFPIAEGRYTFGLMAYIGWGTPTLVHVQLGLMIQVPDPVRLAILGIIKVILPEENLPLMRFQVNFIGAVDFSEKYMFFFATLYDSRILSFTISGDMYFSIDWAGANPNFIFSVGGFHPDFKAPALRGGVGTLQRLTLTIWANNPRLIFTSYFAVTSNTVQFGASIDFYFKVWKARVVGYLYFDALFQFNPFYFRINIGAGLSVMLGGSELCSIHLKGLLEGPNPWHVKGTASFKVWFVKIKVNIDETFGDKKNTTLPPIAILPILVQSIDDFRNWRATLPAQSSLLVSVRKLEGETLVAHPFSILEISQNKLPLQFGLHKLGSNKPSDYNKFEIQLKGFSAPGKVTDLFAVAQYVNLSDSEKISRKSYEPLASGVKAVGKDGFDSNDYVEKKLRHEVCIVDSRQEPAQPVGRLAENELLFKDWIRGNAVSRSALAKEARLRLEKDSQRLKLTKEPYFIVRADNHAKLKIADAVQQFETEAEAYQSIESLTQQFPEIKGQLKVVTGVG